MGTWLSANPGATVAECREAGITITSAVLEEYGSASSALACDLFDAVMEAEGINVPGAQALSGVRSEAVGGTVRRVVGDVGEGGDGLARFVEHVGALAAYETRRAATDTMTSNVSRAARTRSGRNVRYARVPSGLDPCTWCAMLASRGFVYTSSDNAEAGSHHHCTCTVVPGVKGRTQVDGYDPDYFMGAWKSKSK